MEAVGTGAAGVVDATSAGGVFAVENEVPQLQLRTTDFGMAPLLEEVEIDSRGSVDLRRSRQAITLGKLEEVAGPARGGIPNGRGVEILGEVGPVAIQRCNYGFLVCCSGADAKPVIGLSGNPKTQDIAEAKKLGVVDYYVKDSMPAEHLVQKIKAILLNRLATQLDRPA